ncbi:MAG TPA: MauE/DoxX family redox-associated membrane protein [Chthonomonas sp.]|jgi:hypothetical protein|uniref:MauE/DoxX family redox-associated membrane protein n=1 Tax=Chthonomonas sp. TaxID=2282153 RepID=UPI002B4B7A17|nr:MauE/DoxX family redox-associated membrane protein [Chthonomonas sp.]HLH81524.1 MauE/DoxX family redox-associated membrane protein [Chthonomonas sp.]
MGKRAQENIPSFLIAFPIGVLYGLAAIAKLQSFSNLVDTVRIAQLIPEGWVVLFAKALLFVEVCIALGCLYSPTRLIALKTALMLSGVYLGYGLWRLIEQIPVPCTCFGVWFKMPPFLEIVLNLFLIGYLSVSLRYLLHWEPRASSLSTAS